MINKKITIIIMINLIFWGCKKEIPNNYKVSLFNAVKSGDINLIKSFVEKGVDVNTRNKYGWTPLHWAAFRGKTEVVKLLIEKGADVNTKTTKGWWCGFIKYGKDSTPLYMAVNNGHTEVVKLLIEKGANVNAKDINGWTPLHVAALSGVTEVAKLLIEKGADVKAKTTRGWGTSFENIKYPKGSTPLDFAIIRNNKWLRNNATIKLLKNYSGKCNTQCGKILQRNDNNEIILYDKDIVY